MFQTALKNLFVIKKVKDNGPMLLETLMEKKSLQRFTKKSVKNKSKRVYSSKSNKNKRR